MLSVNGKLICKPYKEAIGIKTEVRKGMAIVRQKVNLVGIELLVGAIIDGQSLPASSLVYIQEDKFAQGPYTVERKSDSLAEPFIVVNSDDVVFVEERAKKA